jgi:threonine/homoserine/homoserine lactone efflux protein
MEALIGLAGYAFVAAVTPGPNNVILWAAGVQFGFRATLPYIAGIAIGVGAMILAAAAGIGALIAAVPALETLLKLAGSAYLLYLAYRIAGSAAVREGEVASAPSFRQSIGFQFVNVKAWFFVLGAVSAFRPPGTNLLVGALLMTALCMAIIVPSASVWAAGGHVLGRFVTGSRTHRAISLVLALLLAGMVILIWL